MRNFAVENRNYTTAMRSLTPIIKNLLIINVLMFAATFVLGQRGIDLDKLLGLHFLLSHDFMPHQLVSYMFMHGSFMHLFLNMFALWMFGGIIEQTLGPKRFLIYYFVCGIGAGLCQELAQFIHYTTLDTFQALDASTGEMVNAVSVSTSRGEITAALQDYINSWNCVGASGSIYGVLLAFGMDYPNERMFIIPIPIPIKAKYFVIGYAVIEVMEMLTQPGDGVGHVAHLGGMLFGLILILLWRRWDNRRKSGTVYVTFDSYNRGY